MRAHTYLNVKRAAFLSVSALALSIASVTPAAAEQQFELLEVTVSDLQEAYEDGTYTAEQVTQSYLERIELYEDHYNAFTFLNDQALEEARASDERIQNGEAVHSKVYLSSLKKLLT
ncbi:amidase family protein [Geomicrobium sp. JCM 19038]|uniref:amidase family protein n=1 Tax=Geomicrobium sp. JCM 19038 TaxID=1460635 RepID=UPI00045F4530|nr:amidase family protein [Geomicrobium sp. JCM 19038]GAK08843.1 hypothetical protein JCM19038_2641 [Geomicrobium sp. JCM 19038]